MGGATVRQPTRPFVRPCFDGILTDSSAWPHGTAEKNIRTGHVSGQRRPYIPPASAIANPELKWKIKKKNTRRNVAGHDVT